MADAREIATAFARRLRANADHAEALKFTVCNLSTMDNTEARLLAGFIEKANTREAGAQEPVAVPAGIEAAAAFLAKAAFGTCYASLRGDGSIRERGFEPVIYSTWGGQQFQGTKRDMDDLVREIVRLAADPVSPAAEPPDNALRCFICREPILKGQMVLSDYTEGLGHRGCFGNDRDGFCNLETGEPLGPDEPLPEGEPYEPEGAASPAADSGESEDEMIQRILDAPIEDVVAELREQGIDPEAGVKLVDDMAAQAHALASHAPAPQPGGVDTRPANCRFRLEDEGKPHPKSGCEVSGCRGVFGALCRAALSTPPAGEG